MKLEETGLGKSLPFRLGGVEGRKLLWVGNEVEDEEEDFANLTEGLEMVDADDAIWDIF